MSILTNCVALLQSELKVNDDPVIKANLDNVFRLLLTEHDPMLPPINAGVFLDDVIKRPSDPETAQNFSDMVDTRWFFTKPKADKTNYNLSKSLIGPVVILGVGALHAWCARKKQGLHKGKYRSTRAWQPSPTEVM